MGEPPTWSSIWHELYQDAGPLLNLHQLRTRTLRRSGAGKRRLRSPPVVDIAHLVHTTNRAVRSTRLLRQELPLHIHRPVLPQRNPRIPALLRAVMHQPKLTDVQIPSTRPAAPVVRLPVRNRLLKVIERP